MNTVYKQKKKGDLVIIKNCKTRLTIIAATVSHTLPLNRISDESNHNLTDSINQIIERVCAKKSRGDTFVCKYLQGI